MKEEKTWNHSRLLFWVNILRMKYSFFVVLVFSLLFGSPSVDVTRQKFEWNLKARLAVEDSSRNDSTWTHFFCYIHRSYNNGNKNLAVTKHLHEAYNLSKLIIFRACVRASKSFEWKSFFLIDVNNNNNNNSDDLYWGNFFTRRGFRKGPGRLRLKYIHKIKRKKRNYN